MNGTPQPVRAAPHISPVMIPLEKPPATPPRIVAALTTRERTLFLERALAHAGFRYPIVYADERDLAADRWQQQLEAWQPDILLTAWSAPRLPESWLTRPGCPLRYVCHVVGTVRQLVPRAFIERGGLVTNWGERISGQVAEHGLLLALAALRNQGAWGPYIARPLIGRQITDLRTRTLFGLRVGLHGFGSVARSLLPLLRPFNVSLTVFSAGVPEEIFTQAGVRSVPTLSALFAESDVLFECESLTPSTQGTVSAALLAALPTGAVFVNIGRGGVVDDEALLREGVSGGSASPWMWSPSSR